MTIGKKLRFEVFKRDSFTCQYCGKSAPDVMLQVDHIHPVSKGGDDNILNLITSCWDCNIGKGGRELSDNTVVTKQRDQLFELQERREQIEMMMEWRRGLIDLEENIIYELDYLWMGFTHGYGLDEMTEDGFKPVKRLLKKYELALIIQSMEIAADTYIQYDGTHPIQESCITAFKKIQNICYIKSIEKERPYIHDLFYIRGILKNTCYERYLPGCIEFLCYAIDSGVPIEELRRRAKKARYYDKYEEEIEILINQGD